MLFLRDAYPWSLEETILTEITANSLDSGAASIRIEADQAASALTGIDDGAGMQRRDLARYHDIASSGKTRGQGIGFAGVGMKLGLLASTEVVTETRRGATHVATSWNLASRRRAPREIISRLLAQATEADGPEMAGTVWGGVGVMHYLELVSVTSQSLAVNTSGCAAAARFRISATSCVMLPSTAR